MKKISLSGIVSVVIVAGILLSGCSSVTATGPISVAPVQRGDLEVKVSADGNIEMPLAVNLYFDTTMFTPPYSGRIKSVYVEKGDIVKAGALLAKLDDTTQKLAVESAQYALELAMNNVVQTVCCGVNRAPGFYCDAVAFLRFEFARKELESARTLFQADNYVDAATQISLAKFDLDGSKKFYSDPDYRRVRPDLIDVTQAAYSDYDIDLAIERMSAEIDNLSALQALIKAGSYDDAVAGLQTMLDEMDDTYSVVKRLNHLPQNASYPDTCTSYTVLNEVMNSVDLLQDLARQKDFDGVKFAETLATVRHDLELSEKILDENISTYRQGLNMKTLRDYNINVQSAIINLQRTKQALLKTELLAPFDGKVVDVNLRAGDMISQRYTVTGIPIDSYVIQLANVDSMRMTGQIDEIDIVKIANKPLEELTPVILVDAFPGKQFKGKVTFISPFGPTQASGIQYYGTLQPTVSTYKVEIALDPQETAYLTGGLTATAEILIDTRKGVLIVPNGAVGGGNGNYSVRVLKDEKTGVIEQRPVTVGLQNRTYTEIVSGLVEGEKVVLEKAAVPAKALRK
ncbi:MAG: HlyD family efflux transporter periplasmic adaptor subunit [Chloroflexi bacterium]|nr:HlyD family efflux transporter periplasmic adaptor subunit [Chloroflexota bacterium]